MVPSSTQFATDVLVIGSGASGVAAAAAAAAAGADVLMLSKDPAVCSDSKISEGIVAVPGAGSAADSPQELAANMRVGGAGLPDAALTAQLAANARRAYAWLGTHGLRAATTCGGEPVALPLPLGGHSRPRSVDHVNGGRDVSHALTTALHNAPATAVIEDCWVADLLSTPAGVCGAIAYRASRGDWITVRAGAVVLACGGTSTLFFPDTDTMRGNTGDGYAMALRAGAALVDMEQVQFLPFAIAHPPSCRGLLAGEPVTAGPLGVLRDRDGRVIVGELMARTRAEVAAAMARAIADGRGTERGGCYLDLTANARGSAGTQFVRLMRAKIPGVLQTVRRAMGRNAAAFETMWEVVPSAHYCMGGVQVDNRCRALRPDGTPVQRLLAAGQVMGGLHGANRLGSTSLTETLVFGRVAGQQAAAVAADPVSSRAFEPSAASMLARYAAAPARGAACPIELTRSLQAACRRDVGPGRTGAGLQRADAELATIAAALDRVGVGTSDAWSTRRIAALELANMTLTARAITASARARTGTRGAHVRLDRGRDRRRLSVQISLDGAALAVATVPRPALPWWRRAPLALRRALTLAGLRVLRALPPRAADAVLVRAYARLLPRAGVATAKEIA